MTEGENEIHTDYKNRINRVFKYMDENLDADLSLSTISEIAYFSPFHFHRIFKFVTGETLNAYVTRRRIEQSASDIIHKNIPITEIAIKNGFKENSSLTRAFKKYYGVSPTNFKKQNPKRFSKIRQLESKNGQGYPDYEQYICIIDNLKGWIKMNADIKIKELPKMDLAFVTSIGAQNVGAAYQKLLQWAIPKGLMNDQSNLVTIYHDSFKITEANKVRISACISLSDKIETEGEVGLSTNEGGKCIVGSFEIGFDEFEKSWTGLFIWMKENGYKKADRNPFEIYHNDYHDHPELKCIVDFCIPIE